MPGDVSVGDVSKTGERHHRQRRVSVLRSDIQPYHRQDQQDAEQAQCVGDRQDVFFRQSASHRSPPRGVG